MVYISLLILTISTTAAGPQSEHLEPVPIHNGEINNQENWGWYHPATGNGGALQSEGAARIRNHAQKANRDSEYFDGNVVVLEAGAAAVMGIEDRFGGTVQLQPGATYEVAWSQGALASDPPPTVAVSIISETLKEIPGSRATRTGTGKNKDSWSRQRVRVTIPANFAPESGQLLAFQNMTQVRDATESVALIDKVSLAQVTQDGPDFEPLFDGVSLDGWVGAVKGYQVVDNTIQMNPDASAAGNLYTKEPFGDFVFRFEFKLTPGANNGIGIRAPLGGDAAYKGMEIQVLENSHPKYAGLQPWQFHGSIYGIAAAQRGYLRPPGEWNTEEIHVQGRNVRVTLNGHVILDQNLDEATKDGTLSGRDHPGLKRANGHIAFCSHGDEVAFRAIRIKNLGTSGTTPLTD